MAGKIRSIISKIGRGVSGLFSKKPKVKPAKKTPIQKLSQAGYEIGRELPKTSLRERQLRDKVPGRLGMHLRDVAHPMPESELDVPEFRYALIETEDVDDFVHKGIGLYVYSSNVASASYDIGTKRMRVAFLDGSVYEYWYVTEQEAYSFAHAGSKGKWCWDNLRIRGTKKGHRKPYRKLA